MYAPLRAAATRNGAVAMMGTGLTKMTIIHAAEELAGRSPFVQWAYDRDRETVAVRVGSCSEGFERLAPVLAPREQRLRAGGSMWRVFDAAASLQSAAVAIRDDPEIARCGDPDCDLCPDAVAGGPFWPTGSVVRDEQQGAAT